jgi:hypothetical protein
MSTPAAAVLSGTAAASSGAAAAGGAAPGGASGAAASAAAAAAANAGGAAGAAGGGGSAANQPFWNGWDKPDQKETRDWVANKAYADPFVLAKTAQGLEREAATLRSAKGYPSDVVAADGTVTKADENARRAWNAAVGVPETHAAYEIPLPANNPYPEFAEMMKQEFHKAGVPAAMAPQLAKGYEAAVMAMETKLRASEDAASQSALLKLQQDWGPQYQERVAIAARGKDWLAREVGGMNEVQMRTLESVLGTDKFMAAMWKIGAGNKEAGFAGGLTSGGGQFQGGASEAQTQLDTLQADRSAGRISDATWREHSKSGGLLDTLRDKIVAGMATQQ